MRAITTVETTRRTQAVAGVILSYLAENKAKYFISTRKSHIRREFVKSHRNHAYFDFELRPGHDQRAILNPRTVLADAALPGRTSQLGRRCEHQKAL